MKDEDKVAFHERSCENRVHEILMAFHAVFN